jgi:GH15 family glucan-1,4-alpha-glucosidase
VLDGWPGFGGDGPVRVGNGAAAHLQNDVFGEMVLALAPIFMDERFSAERSAAALRLIERLARKAISVAGTPDAGIWEYRTEWKPQTFSSLMSWAGAERMARVAAVHAVAFIICTFWLAEALAVVGRKNDAKQVMDRAISALSPLGLLSEDYEASSLQMWGNFPQAYSHVGLIHAAFAASPPWAELL